MANYQNNMRYGRQNTMRQMRPSCGNYASPQVSMPTPDTGCSNAGPMPGKESRCTASDSCQYRQKDPLYGMPLAMAYVPWQSWGSLYDVCEGLSAGTVFEELDKPFLGRGGWKR